MKYPITEYDKELLLQHSLHYKVKISITNDENNIMDVLWGVASIGGGNIDSESNIRRTFNCILKLDDFIGDIESKISNWIGLYYDISIGILDQRIDEYKYYPYGRFCITSAGTSYDEKTNSLSLDLSDRMAELDGTRNGQLGGAPTITIPKEVDGKKQTLRGTVINILTSSSKVDKYIVDDVGEFYGMSQNNANYEEYRKKNDEWNVLPYDLEYSSGNFVSDMLFEIRDLYPNCQMYFDVYDNFCFDMIPSLEDDLPDMDNDYLQSIITGTNSESVTYDVQAIRNVTEVFGKTYEIDYYAENTTCSNNIYNLTIQNCENYVKYDIVAFKPTANNGEAPYLKINSLNAIPIYYEYTSIPLSANECLNGDMNVFEIYKIEDKYIAYYLGKYQPHALCVLVNNANDKNYTKEYFSKTYNVEKKNVYFRVEPFSPFSVQCIHEVLDSKASEDFDNILSDSNAIDHAKYYNRISSTMYDTVTITTILIPWLDVNTKVNYKKAQEDNVYSYVVKSKSDNFQDGTSTITMYRFLQIYE